MIWLDHDMIAAYIGGRTNRSAHSVLELAAGEWLVKYREQKHHGAIDVYKTELWNFAQEIKMPMREEIIEQIGAKFGLRDHGAHAVLCDIINEAMHNALAWKLRPPPGT